MTMLRLFTLLIILCAHADSLEIILRTWEYRIHLIINKNGQMELMNIDGKRIPLDSRKPFDLIKLTEMHCAKVDNREKNSIIVDRPVPIEFDGFELMESNWDVDVKVKNLVPVEERKIDVVLSGETSTFTIEYSNKKQSVIYEKTELKKVQGISTGPVDQSDEDIIWIRRVGQSVATLGGEITAVNVPLSNDYYAEVKTSDSEISFVRKVKMHVVVESANLIAEPWVLYDGKPSYLVSLKMGDHVACGLSILTYDAKEDQCIHFPMKDIHDPKIKPKSYLTIGNGQKKHYSSKCDSGTVKFTVHCVKEKTTVSLEEPDTYTNMKLSGGAQETGAQETGAQETGAQETVQVKNKGYVNANQNEGAPELPPRTHETSTRSGSDSQHNRPQETLTRTGSDSQHNRAPQRPPPPAQPPTGALAQPPTVGAAASTASAVDDGGYEIPNPKLPATTSTASAVDDGGYEIPNPKLPATTSTGAPQIPPRPQETLTGTAQAQPTTDASREDYDGYVIVDEFPSLQTQAQRPNGAQAQRPNGAQAQRPNGAQAQPTTGAQAQPTTGEAEYMQIIDDSPQAQTGGKPKPKSLWNKMKSKVRSKKQ